MISRDEIASLVAKPTTPYLDHHFVGLGIGREEVEGDLVYLPETRTLSNIYITTSKLKYAINTSFRH